MNALVNRHGAPAPQPTRRWRYAHGFISELITDRPWDVHDIDPSGRDEWMMKWPLTKQLSILRSEAEDPVQPWRSKANIKRESGPKLPTKARLIQAYYTQSTQSEYGPMFHALQKAVFGWINDRPRKHGVKITIASGQPPAVMARWMERVHERWARPIFRERDGKNWDSTMGKWAFDLFMRLAQSVDAGFAKFVQQGYAAMGYAFFESGIFKYRLVGGTKSGFNQTTFFNSLINAMIAYETLRHFGVDGEILVAGDDLLIATGCDQSGHAEFEAGFGIVPESRIFDDYVDVTFISSCWLRGSSGFRFVPILGRLLARLALTVNPPLPSQLDSYWYSIVSGLSTAIGALPLYSDYLRANVSELMPLGKDFDYWVAQYGGVEVDGLMEAELVRKYSFTQTEFERLRSYLRGLPHQPCLFKYDLVEEVLKRDLSDLLDRPLAAAA
jgi:hypothetical protein